MALKFYTTVVKGLKLKVKKFLSLNPMFAEVTGEKLMRGGKGCPFASILNRVKYKPFTSARMIVV